MTVITVYGRKTNGPRFAPPEGIMYPRGPRVFWQFGPSGTANQSKSSVNVPSGRAVVRAQRAQPRQ